MFTFSQGNYICGTSKYFIQCNFPIKTYKRVWYQTTVVQPQPYHSSILKVLTLFWNICWAFQRTPRKCNFNSISLADILNDHVYRKETNMMVIKKFSFQTLFRTRNGFLHMFLCWKQAFLIVQIFKWYENILLSQYAIFYLEFWISHYNENYENNKYGQISRSVMLIICIKYRSFIFFFLYMCFREREQYIYLHIYIHCWATFSCSIVFSCLYKLFQCFYGL